MQQPPVFDAHFHLADASFSYDLSVNGKNIIFNDVNAYRAFRRDDISEPYSVSLVVDIGSAFDYVRSEAEAGRIQGLKIHSRVQRLTERDWPTLMRRLENLPSELPVIVDAFYHGKDLDVQPSLRSIIALIDRFQERHFIIAHCGGYRLLQYFFHLRECQNVSYDLSVALQYFADSSLWADLQKLIYFTNKDRIIFGTDYPYASPNLQYRNFLRIAENIGLSAFEVGAILYGNAARAFTKSKIL